MYVQSKWEAAFQFIKLLFYYRKCVFSIVCLILYCKKCVFKASRKLLFSLLSYFYNTKNVCSKQAGNRFLVYSATFVIQNMFVQIKWEVAF